MNKSEKHVYMMKALQEFPRNLLVQLVFYGGGVVPRVGRWMISKSLTTDTQ